MKYLQAALAISATMFCYTGFAEEESAKDNEVLLRVGCQQIVQDIDQKMGQGVAFCIPAASVLHGQPDSLMIVSRVHFSDEERRATWVGFSIVTAAQAVAKLSASSELHLTALMIDQADKDRQSLDDLTLCSVLIEEAEILSHRVQADNNFGEVYKNSSCYLNAARKSASAKK